MAGQADWGAGRRADPEDFSVLPGPSRLRHRILLLAAVLALALAGVPGADVEPAGAQSPTTRTIQITGHGWGHGRGLGQYGAYGYASRGWSSAQILDHYYGGTTAGPAPTDGPIKPDLIRVELRGMRGRSTAVALANGTLSLRSMDHAELGRHGAGAVRLRWVSNGFQVETAPGCDGPWTAAEKITGQTTVRVVAETGAGGTDGLLAACSGSGRTWYQGEIRAVINNGAAYTVNTLPVEAYLRGVVPNEMPASWPGAALQAQAVAARSYAMAGDSRQQPWADTCDTVLCQVYDGAYTERGGTFRAATKVTSDAAIQATAGLVRLDGAGKPARTEFSSSTGGWTVGGSFPAVVDEGDDIAANPNHNWTTTVLASTLEARYSKGKLLAMEVTGRNGVGADGGRVTAVKLTFERGTVNETASTVRNVLGLKSDWFTPGPVTDTAVRSTADGQWIDMAYTRLVGRAATDGELTRWYDGVRRGDKLSVTSELVKSDYFAGRMVDDLYQRALGRPADADGRAYWVAQLGKGTKLESVGVLFYGSREYYLRSGGNDGAFVGALYRDILGRSADPGGQGYWQDRLGTRQARPDDVAVGFYVSLESRRSRAAALFGQVVGGSPGGGTDALANRLLSVSDLTLAAEIAATN